MITWDGHIRTIMEDLVVFYSIDELATANKAEGLTCVHSDPPPDKVEICHGRHLPLAFW
jgi:hypothetical protein